VCFSFDTDSEPPLLRDGTTSPTTLSASDFGAESGRHEVGVHGWIHEFTPRLGEGEEERLLLDQAIAYLTTATGKRPVDLKEAR
jgi:hypothetical protein